MADVRRGRSKSRSRSPRGRDRRDRQSSASRSASRDRDRPAAARDGDRRKSRRRDRSISSSSSGSSGSTSSRRQRRRRSRRGRSASRSRSRSRSKDRKHRKREKKEKKEKKSKRDKHDRHSDVESAQPTAVLPPAAPFEVPPKKKAKGGKDDGAAKIAEMFGYTADNNPFGDANLTETFVWKKKIQKEVDTGVRTSAPTKTEQRAARDALVDEIERAKARRIAREKEKEEMERLRAEESRLRDAEQYAGWERQEEEFHRAQTAQRSLIRIREGREKPVDIIAKNALLVAQCESGQDLEEANKAVAGDVELHPPSSVYAQLPSHELEDLLVDAQAFADFEGQRGARAPFWNALRIVVTDELERARAREAGLAAGKSLGSLQAVEGEMDAMFEGKSEEQLRDMEQQVRGTIRGALEAAARPSSSAPSGPVVDVEYWERVLRHLQVAQARAALTRLHEETLLARLKQLEDRREVFAAAGITSRAVGAMAGAGAGEGFEAGGWEPDYGVAEGASASAAPAKPAKASAPAGSLSPELIPFDDRADRDAAAASGAPRAGGAYSPPLEPLEGHAVGQSLPAVELGPAATSAGAGASSFSSSSSAVDAAEDRKRLLQRRIALLRSSGVLPPEGGAGAAAGGAAPGGVPGAGEGLERTFTDDSGRVLPTGFGETDMGAAAEVAAAGGAAGSAAAPQPPAHMLMSPVELRAWQDKYRPRKPRFFNRIRTGYDWNRYNKSHYDYDNPPPKTVQGYKFNMFYPDLVDRSRTPRYVLEPADSDKYCIIRFTAGPPYEDVAFKIVNREWETQKKHGFRCSFDRGVLQLHFNFKRMFWRK